MFTTQRPTHIIVVSPAEYKAIAAGLKRWITLPKYNLYDPGDFVLLRAPHPNHYARHTPTLRTKILHLDDPPPEPSPHPEPKRHADLFPSHWIASILSPHQTDDADTSLH